MREAHPWKLPTQRVAQQRKASPRPVGAGGQGQAQTLAVELGTGPEQGRAESPTGKGPGWEGRSL